MTPEDRAEIDNWLAIPVNFEDSQHSIWKLLRLLKAQHTDLVRLSKTLGGIASCGTACKGCRDLRDIAQRALVETGNA